MKKLILYILTLGVSLSMTTTSMAISFSTNDYKIINIEYGWDYANKQALELGSGWHLAVITSQEEQNFVANLLNATDRNPGQYWIGGFQTPGTVIGSENWHWVTPETWSYTAWNAGEPNDYKRPDQPDETFLTMDYRAVNSDGIKTWQWNDEPLYAYIGGYVAEYNAVPEPSTLLLLGAGLLGASMLRRRNKK